MGVGAVKTYRDGQEITSYFWQDPLNASRLPAGKELTLTFPCSACTMRNAAGETRVGAFWGFLCQRRVSLGGEGIKSTALDLI